MLEHLGIPLDTLVKINPHNAVTVMREQLWQQLQRLGAQPEHAAQVRAIPAKLLYICNTWTWRVEVLPADWVTLDAVSCRTRIKK
jgi:hypothetical protein